LPTNKKNHAHRHGNFLSPLKNCWQVLRAAREKTAPVGGNFRNCADLVVMGPSRCLVFVSKKACFINEIDAKITDMKNAILIHGKPGKEEYYSPTSPSASNFQWLPWLQKQLIIAGIPTQTPEMFMAWQPDYRIWSKELSRHEITPETILVGHSCGGGFIVQWLSEHKDVKVDKAILVAPWLGPIDNSETDDKPVGGFFNFDIDPELANRVNQITIFNSDNDAASIHTAVKRIREAIPSAEYKEFHNYGHFCGGDFGNGGFKELLEVCLN